MKSEPVTLEQATRRNCAEQPVATVAWAEDADEAAAREVQADCAGRKVLVGGYLEFHVGQQPGLAVSTATEVDAEGMAHWTAHPVGADHPQA